MASKLPKDCAASTFTLAPSPRLAGLDGLRGLAILVVLLNHFLQNLNATTPFQRALLAPFQSGWGIAVFLTLSGFLVGSSLYKNETFTAKDARLFLFRRALRVLPLYYAILIITLLLLPRLWPDLAARQTYLHSNQRWLWILFANTAIAHQGQWLFYGNPINLVHLWTISLQEQFVLLALLIACLVPRKTQAAFLTLMITISLLLRLLMFQHGYPGVSLYTFTFARTDSFFAGSALALAWRRGIDLRKGIIPALVCLFAGTLIWAIAAFHQAHLWNGPFMTTFGYSLQAAVITSLLLLLLALPSAHITRLLDLRLLTLFGRFSFGIYILHMLVFSLVSRSLRRWTPSSDASLFSFGWIVASVSVAASLGAAAACYHTFERPFLDIKESLRRGKTSLAPRPRWRPLLQPALAFIAVCLTLTAISPWKPSPSAPQMAQALAPLATRTHQATLTSIRAVALAPASATAHNYRFR